MLKTERKKKILQMSHFSNISNNNNNTILTLLTEKWKYYIN